MLAFDMETLSTKEGKQNPYCICLSGYQVEYKDNIFVEKIFETNCVL